MSFFNDIFHHYFTLLPEQEVKDTLDKEAVYRCMEQCYTMHQADKPKWEDVMKLEQGNYFQSAKSIASFGSNLLQGVVVSLNTVQNISDFISS